MTATTVPSNAREPVLERLGRLQVEVVGRLVEEQQRGAVELQQQDLEPGLLTAGQRLEELLRAPLQLVAAEHAHGRPADDVALLEELEQGAAVPVRVLVGLVEVARDDPGAEAHLAVVRHARVAGDQAEEVALARAVRPEHGHPLAVPDLGVEGVGQAVQREPLDHERLAPGAPAARGGRRPAGPARAPGAWSAPRSAGGGSRPP